jgi:hypothetical protein
MSFSNVPGPLVQAAALWFKFCGGPGVRVHLVVIDRARFPWYSNWVPIIATAQNSSYFCHCRSNGFREIVEYIFMCVYSDINQKKGKWDESLNYKVYRDRWII